MKKIKFILFAFLATVSIVNAQDEDSTFSDVSISMDFNKELYPIVMGNVFVSEDPKAMLMATFAPQSLESLEEELDSDFSGGELKNIKKGMIDIKGTKVLYITGNFTDENGEDYLIEMLAKKNDKDNSIVVITFYDPNAKRTFENEAKKAIVSAKVDE